MVKKPMVLIILDGYGYRETQAHNPTRTAQTPTLDQLFSDYPHLLIEASGEAVGLPEGQMGNSEVGHLHIGAGRKVPQDLVRINQAIKSHEIAQNPVLQHAFTCVKKNNSTVHILGLLSDGGVHSHIDHITALMQLAQDNGIAQYCLHAFTDGRDTPPQSALHYIQQIEKSQPGKIASVTGRYYAMDRDNRWDRTQRASELLTDSIAPVFQASTATDAVENAYARGEKDEFIRPTRVQDATIQDGDVVIFANFRADRARQLSQALTEAVTLADFVTLTDYSSNNAAHVAYPLISLKNTLGEYLSSKGYSQLRLAETEKYAHVTYFLNGGIEAPYPNEDRHLIPSSKVATYDLQPDMSAIAITDALTKAITEKRYDVIVCNYANPDMVGHTGDEKAAEKAMEVIDACLARVLGALKDAGGEALITADHGNIECMFDDNTQQPHTAHTTNLVPLIYVGRPARVLANTGALDDVAPTLLHLMGLPIPVEMTGKCLFEVG